MSTAATQATADTPLQQAVAAHAPALAAIHAASFPPAEQWGQNVMELQLGLLGAFGLIHPSGGMVLARTAADEAEILTIAVLPEQRRGGLGGVLLRAAMASAVSRGARTMFLEVAIDNTAAQALYARHGFTQVGHRRRYYPDGGDALVLRADLPGPNAEKG